MSCRSTFSNHAVHKGLVELHTVVLEVSLDYLVDATDTLLETSVVNRILDIQKLKNNDK